MQNSYTRVWTLVRTVVTVVALVGCATAAGFLVGLSGFWADASTGAFMGMICGAMFSLILVLPAAIFSGKRERSHNSGCQRNPSESEMRLPNPPGGAGGRG